MSGLPDDPEHFLRFVRRHFDAAAELTTFVPRRVYGAYLEALLDESVQVAAPGASLVRRQGEVAYLTAGSAGGPWLMRFADGSRGRADRVVLALGNLPSRDPALAAGAWPEDPSRYIRDPWRSGALASRAPGPVLLVGTGLTMVDVALQLQAQTPGQQIIALSRGGLFPHAHRIGGAAPAQGIPVPDPTPSLLELLRFVRTAAVVAEVGGGDWRDAVNALRPVTPDLWRHCPRRAAALRRSDSRASGTSTATASRQRSPRPSTRCGESGRLTFASGRIRSVAAAGDGVEVTVQERGNGRARTLRVASVVNCTGPTGNVRAGGSRLLETLCSSGAVRPHPLALGLDTRADGAVRDARGRASETLFALGPLRRGELWESTAVPEIRAQAHALAQHLAQQRSLAAV